MLFVKAPEVHLLSLSVPQHTEGDGIGSLQQTFGPPHGPRPCLIITKAVLSCLCPCPLEPAQFQWRLRAYQGLLTVLRYPSQAQFIFDDVHTKDDILKMKPMPFFFFFFPQSLLDLIERPCQAGGRISRAVVGWWEGGPGIPVFVLNEGGSLPALRPRRARPPAAGGSGSCLRGLWRGPAAHLGSRR